MQIVITSCRACFSPWWLSATSLHPSRVKFYRRLTRRRSYCCFGRKSSSSINSVVPTSNAYAIGALPGGSPHCAAVQEALGYKFTNVYILLEALSHRSVNKQRVSLNRLAFFGRLPSVALVLWCASWFIGLHGLNRKNDLPSPQPQIRYC